MNNWMVTGLIAAVVIVCLGSLVAIVAALVRGTARVDKHGADWSPDASSDSSSSGGSVDSSPSDGGDAGGGDVGGGGESGGGGADSSY